MRKYAQAINRAVDFAASMQLMRGKSYRVRKTTSGQLIDFQPGGKESVSETQAGIRRLKIASVGGESLGTWEYDDDGNLTGESGPDVAIPKYLRPGTYPNQQFGDYVFTESGGEIRMRLITHPNASAYIVQEVFPPYEVGDDVYAIQPQGKTDVTSDGELLEWMDTNVEGRQLRSKFVLVDVCRLEAGVNVARQIPVEGGNVF